MTLQTGKPIPAGSPAVDHGSRPAMPVVPSQGEASGADRLQALEDVAALADELVNGGGLVNRGVDRGLVVVEKADKSDPHYRLCGALDRLAASLSKGKQGEAVAWRWRNKPDGVWYYQEAEQRIPGVEQQPLFAAPPSLPGREELKQIIEEHVWAELAGPREDRAEVWGIANAVDAILARLGHKPEGEG